MPKENQEKLEKNWVDKVAVMIGNGKSTLSEKSIMLYSQRIKRIWKLIHPNKPYKGKFFIHKEVKKIIDAIDKSDMAISSKAGLYAALGSLYNKDSYGIHLQGKKMYERELKKWSDLVKCQEKKQVNTKKEVEKWKTPEELEEGRRKLLEAAEKSGNIKDYRDYVMFSLFVLVPPRRSTDYGEMKITLNKERKGNSLLYQYHRGQKRFSKFVFNEYKLSEKKGSEVFDRVFMKNLPRGKEIIELLDGWLLMNNDGYFLLDARNSSHMSKAITRVSEKALGTPVNINSFRHMYISNFLDTSPFLLEKEMIAKYMSHSVAQQENYRKRPTKKKVVELEGDAAEVKAELKCGNVT